MITSDAERSRTTPETLGTEHIEAYRRDGFVQVPSLITRAEADAYRQAAMDFDTRGQSTVNYSTAVFNQHVNVWRHDDKIKALTLNKSLGKIAEMLAGVPLRLWHDQLLIKKPKNSAPTEFHQDQPYWPHANSTHPISVWIALVDVPIERGCMTFIPGSHLRDDLEEQDLEDATSLFRVCPELTWDRRVTVPLRAGDCTFHHGRCAHMATPNFTDEHRVAHVVIFIDQATTYTGREHVVTDGLGLDIGGRLDHELFPKVS
ncbi:MAG: phytanoyl-CoA dioxygenase family protein [Phycisphaeraceae bacterium]